MFLLSASINSSFFCRHKIDTQSPLYNPAPPASHHAFHCQRKEEGSGTAQGWVGLLWLTRRHWPVWQPDKLTLCLNWPWGIIPRQHASPIGSCHMMLGDSHRPFFFIMKKNKLSPYMGIDGVLYDNVQSCWICKCNVNLGQQNKS